jgi:hypothetical protein
LVYDTLRARVVQIGGVDGNQNPLSEVRDYGPIWRASFQSYAPGCPGTAGLPNLQARVGGLPWIGGVLVLDLAPVPPATNAALTNGISRTLLGSVPLPLDLGFLGMPGCALAASLEINMPLTGSGGAREFRLPLPPLTSLVGGTFYNQAFLTDPGANAMGMVVSNAGATTLGSR